MFARELIVDSFAGGGGASLGIELATGRSPDIAINHDAAALAMHAANHPHTRHVLEDVWRADLKKLVGRRNVGLLWASPDCKHFSRAKGAKPVEKSIRSLAWVVVRWAQQVQPRVIILENVREFADWGPLVPRWRCRECDWRGTEGQAVLKRVRRRCPRCDSAKIAASDELYPDPDRKGITFRRWIGRLKSLGYRCEHRVLDAADYGAPTHRRRLFMIARRDGDPIVWPEPTHGDPARIDDSPLFERLEPWRTAAECIDWSLPCPSIFDRKKPLQEATMRRIAMGIKRYVIDAAEPFIVPMTHTGDRRVHAICEPLPTITTAKRGELAIVSPVLSKYHGQKGDESRCRPLEEPFNTLDTQPRFALIAPTLVRSFGNSTSVPIDSPLPTTTAGGGGKSAMVTAFLAKHFGGVVGVPVSTPLPTITSIATQNQIVTANLVHLNHGDKQWSGVSDPMRTVTTGNHAALVYAFLVKYFGTAIGQPANAPLHTVTAKDRFGVVCVTVAGECYVIVDIGMRMLTPRELARAQGFSDSYQLTGTKTSQVARIGNSVCPVMARALVQSVFAQELVSQ